jgi:hypothetical protein
MVVHGGCGRALMHIATCLDNDLLRESRSWRYSRRKILSPGEFSGLETSVARRNRCCQIQKEHVVERYKVSADGRMLEAAVTVNDPETFNEPLHMIKRWRKVNNQMLETVCAENNGDHFGKNLFPIPQADKPDF